MSDDLIARAEAVMNGINGWTITGGWVCNEVVACTCDGPIEGYGHRPECGLEPQWRIDTHPVLGFAHDAATLLPELLAEVKRLRAPVQRVRELHREETFDSVPSRCHHCWTDYPCPTVRALVGEDL